MQPFICENNFYSVYSPLSVRQPKDRSIAKLAAAIGLKTETGDGNNVLEAFQIVKRSVDWVRKGTGPMFIEFFTYRLREHCGPNYDNDLGYRTQAEVAEWEKRDPIKYIECKIKEGDPESWADMESIRIEVNEEIDRVFKQVQQDPFPNSEDIYKDIYAL